MSISKVLLGFTILFIAFFLNTNPVLALNDTGAVVSSDTFVLHETDTTTNQFQQGALDTAFGWTELFSGFEDQNDPVRAIYVGIRNSVIRHLYGPVKMARSSIKYFDFRSDTQSQSSDSTEGVSREHDTSQTQSDPRKTVQSGTPPENSEESIDGEIQSEQAFPGPKFLLQGVTKNEIFLHIEKQLSQEGFTLITRSDTLVTFEKNDVDHSMVEKARLSFKFHQEKDLVRVYTRARAQFKMMSLVENSMSDVSSRERAIKRLKDLFEGFRNK